MTSKLTFLRACLPAAALFVLTAVSTHAAPTIHIDGQLEPSWQKARPIEAFKTFDGKRPQAATTGRFLTDAENLYLAFQCEEPMMEKLEATPLPRDGSLWTNDCIEIYIAPFQQQEDYYQIIIDTSGQVFDALKRDGVLNARYDLSVTAKTQKQKDGWTLEMAIPLCELGLSNARDALINFGRERKPVPENTSWHGLFGKPETWQPLPLEHHLDIDVRTWNFGEAQYGDNTLTVEFVPGTATPVEILVQAQENEQWKTKSRTTTQSTPGQLTRVILPYTLLPQDMPQRVRYVLQSQEQTVFRTGTQLNLPADALVETLSLPYYYAEENWGFVQLESLLSDNSLKASHIRLIVKAPNGKVVATQEIHPLQKKMRTAFKISSWRAGTGTLTAQLLSNDKLIASRQQPIHKRRGPFH